MNAEELQDAIGMVALMDGKDASAEALQIGRLVIEADTQLAEIKKRVDEVIAPIKKTYDILAKQRTALVLEIEKRFPVEDEKLADEVVSLSYRASELVEVPDVNALDSKYHRTKIEPDKVAIKKDLKAGKSIVGAILRTNYSLQVK